MKLSGESIVRESGKNFNSYLYSSSSLNLKVSNKKNVYCLKRRSLSNSRTSFPFYPQPVVCKTCLNKMSINYLLSVLFMLFSQIVQRDLNISFAGYIPASLSSNIKAMKWLPQNDLLGHKNLKAFVSHVGHNSLYESAYHGVPVVAFPLFADQFFNARKVEYFGLGLQVDHNSFDSEQLFKNINKVITEPR